MTQRPPAQLSNSSMRSLLCPFLFQARYNLATEPEPTTPAARKGTIGHEIAQEYIGHLARHHRKRDFEAYREIILRHCEGLPQSMADSIMQVGSCFVGGFELPMRAESHHTELLLAVDRAGNPIEVNWDAPLHKVIDPAQDCITGQIDYVCSFRGGKKASLFDWKMGEEHVSYDKVRYNPQLMLYAYLWFCHHPECEIITVRLWGVKYGRTNWESVDFTRDYVTPIVQTRIERNFAVLDILAQLPEGTPWPALDGSPLTCQYCSQVNNCPLNQADNAWLMDNPPIAIPRRKPQRKEKAA